MENRFMVVSEPLEHSFPSKSCHKDCSAASFAPKSESTINGNLKNLFTSRVKGEFGIITHSYHARTARECQCGCFCGADSIFGILDFARPTISKYPWEKSRMLWSLMSILNTNVLFYAFKSARNRFFSSFYIRADPMTFFWAPSEILDGGSQNLTKCKDTTPPPAISNDTIALYARF